jgi:hypothetical protein
MIFSPFPCAGENRVRHATFDVTLDESRLTLTARFAEGGSCSFSAPVQLSTEGYVVAFADPDGTTTCPGIPNDFSVRVDGERLFGQTVDTICFTTVVRGAK